MKSLLGRVTPLDVVLIAALLALPGWALVRTLRPGHSAAAAYVYHDGQLVGVYPLSRDGFVTLSCERPNDMKLEFRAGRVRVAESDCPRKICMQEGWVGSPGQSIVCVPNRLIIEIRGRAAQYDAETY